MKTRLRDFIVTREDWIFAVSDYVHENSIRSILRYVPDPKGVRGKEKRYRKLDFDEACEFMMINKPEWVGDVHLVPQSEVKKVLSPSERIPQLMTTNKRIRTIVNVLKRGIPLSKMGVTGSLLLGLENESSDIDFIVYGKAWFLARDIIAEAKKEGIIGEISGDMWHYIYNKRRPEISFGEFISHELRKGNRGMLGDTYFDLLYVRDWEEIEKNPRGVDIGRATIRAVVTNTDYSFDSPAIYKVSHPEISEVLSYTHTYAGQALVGETIEARGIIEKVDDRKRLVIGTKREPKGEWIRSLTLLEGQQ